MLRSTDLLDERIADEDAFPLTGTDRLDTGGRRRVLLTVIAALAVVALFAAGWFAAQTFESPAQKAAKAQAPAAGVVTATVVDGDLSQTVSATATIGRTVEQKVTLNASLASGVVTKNTVATGARVVAGSTVMEVSGRPVVAMPGSFPFYRTLGIGDHGPDVRQLQAGLAAAGFAVTPDGSFGAATGRAVESLYAHAGYSVPTVDVAAEASTSGTASDASGTTAAAGSGTGSGTDADETPDTAAAASSSSSSTPGADTTTRLAVPPTELIVFSSLPADLTAVPSVGTVLGSSSSVTVEAGAVIATAPVAAGAAATVEAGMHGVITGPDGTRKDVTVSRVDAEQSSDATVTPSGSTADGAADGGVTIGGDAAPGSDTSDADGSTVVLTATGGAFPSSWLHASGVAVITVQVAAKASLIVPSIAVVSGAEGPAHVLRRQGDGSYVAVGVREIGALDGKSAVQPSKSGALRVGDLVKVG